MKNWSKFRHVTMLLVVALLYVVAVIVRRYAHLDAFVINMLLVAAAFPVVLWFRGRRAEADVAAESLGACCLMLIVMANTIFTISR